MSISSRQRAKEKFIRRGNLKLFGDFDERGYHPTLEFKFVKDETGHLIGALQLFRHGETKAAEWRACPTIDLPASP